MKMSPSAPDSDLYLVVDGGGTKTDCQVLRRAADTFAVLGQGRSTGCNPNAIGAVAAAAAIAEAVGAAKQSAGIARDVTIRRAAIAVAGTADEHRRTELEQLLQDCGIATECRVFSDVIPILMAASSSGPAAALISGTGATAVARNAAGEHVIAGGWGYLLGDEGSGFSIGREAIRQTLLELESGDRRSLLAERIGDRLAANTATAIKRTVYRPESHRELLAAMAPIVLECAAAGDEPARRIIDQAIQQLRVLLDRAASRVSLAHNEVPVAATGGMFKPGSPLRQPLEQALLGESGYASVCFVTEPLECVHRLLLDENFSSPIQFVD